MAKNFPSKKNARLIFFSIIFTLFLFEFFSFLLLKIRPDLRFHLPTFAEEKIHSNFEIPESFSKQKTIYGLHKIVNNPFGTKIEYESAYENNLWLPLKGKSKPNKFIDEKTGKILWTTINTSDEMGRRITSWNTKRLQSAKKHILGFGCSVTYGHGVNDDETFLAQLTKDEPNLISYNAAFEGYGPGENLIRAKKTNLLEKIKPVNGVGIYFYYSFHFERFFNSAVVAGSW